jgi:hypothetical protein
MRTVAIVAPHFPPSSLAGVHRARLWAQHLHEFDWKPIIVTTHHDYYEEALDWDLAGLVDPALDIVRTRALATRPMRLIGDIGVRAFPWHLSALRWLKRERQVDFVHITVPSFYSALLGSRLFAREPQPFGIDYMDPWVHTWPAAEIRYSKAWVSMKLGERLEPYAVRHVALITGVAEGYYAGVLQRHPQLAEQCVTAAMPCGFTTRDFQSRELQARKPKQFDPADGKLHLVYAGALLPKGFGVLERLLEGLALLRTRDADLGNRFRLHFIGTGKSPNDEKGHNVAPIAARLGVGDLVDEHPHRMGYLEVLSHLIHAYGAFIIGSTEAHYTPSKVYQSVQSRRPVLAMLHEASQAVEVLERSRAGLVLRLNERTLPDAAAVADALGSFATLPYDAEAVEWSAFEDYSARESARKLALAMDEAMVRYASRLKR